MGELNWRDAIIRVLDGRSEPMQYTEIAESISQGKLKTKLGATPAQTVNATISVSIKKDGDGSPFVRVARGYYSLRKATEESRPDRTKLDKDETEQAGLIHAFGMYWARSRVDWTQRSPRILGRQQLESTPVDFCSERGVYLLHDGRPVVYAGRSTDQTLGIRLRQHTTDRLNGRWDRFSWFGVDRVTDSGKLESNAADSYNLEMLIATMEALLIEGLEPPQNRRRGDDFKAIEFLQVEDPEFERSRVNEVLDSLKSKPVGR